MLFEIGGTPIPVRWYRAKDTARVFPADHCFFSLDWEDDKGSDRLGEQRPPRGTWNAGMRPAALLGDGHFRGDVEAFQEGISSPYPFGSEISSVLEPVACVCGTGPFDAPAGFEDIFPVWHIQCGGLRWAEENNFPVAPAVFNVTLWNGPPPVDIDGGFTLTFNPVSGKWEGSTVFACIGGFTFLATIIGTISVGGIMSLTITVPTSGCGAGGTMTGKGAFIFYDAGSNSPFYSWDNTLPDFNSPPVTHFTFDP
jgi:hypothetical protein